jgi:hypothetical protein
VVGTPALLTGIVGAAFFAGAFVSDILSSQSLGTPSQHPGDVRLAQQIVGAAKGDRMARPSPSREQASVSTVEVVGVSHAIVILRDEGGAVLYRSDPKGSTTVVAKNSLLPVITLKEGAGGPAIQHPAIRTEGTETLRPPSTQSPRDFIGCAGDVSPLVRASATRGPSLCLVQRERVLL